MVEGSYFERARVKAREALLPEEPRACGGYGSGLIRVFLVDETRGDRWKGADAREFFLEPRA